MRLLSGRVHASMPGVLTLLDSPFFSFCWYSAFRYALIILGNQILAFGVFLSFSFKVLL